MSGTTREIKLSRAANRLSSKASYIARLAQRYSLDYDEILRRINALYRGPNEKGTEA